MPLAKAVQFGGQNTRATGAAMILAPCEGGIAGWTKAKRRSASPPERAWRDIGLPRDRHRELAPDGSMKDGLRAAKRPARRRHTRLGYKPQSRSSPTNRCASAVQPKMPPVPVDADVVLRRITWMGDDHRGGRAQQSSSTVSATVLADIHLARWRTAQVRGWCRRLHCVAGPADLGDRNATAHARMDAKAGAADQQFRKPEVARAVSVEREGTGLTMHAAARRPAGETPADGIGKAGIRAMAGGAGILWGSGRDSFRMGAG